MKVLLLGGTGQLGQDLLKQRPAELQVIAPPRSELDLLDHKQITAFLENEKPNLIINTTAFHVVLECESKPEQAFATNAHAVTELAQKARAIDARFVTYSTDYVFSGDFDQKPPRPYQETDAPHPVQVYGNSKLAGEKGALTEHPQGTLVIRTCGLYGKSGSRARGGNFIEQRAADALDPQFQDTPLEVGNDQTVSPTATHDLAIATWQLIQHPARCAGVFHLVNEGAITWFELTRKIFSLVRSKRPLIAVDRGGISGKMKRPRYSALDCSKARALGIRMRPWEQALEHYLGTIHSTQ